MTDPADSRGLCEGLIREFLKKNGYSNALSYFEKELELKGVPSIDRNTLRTRLGLNRVAVRFKKQAKDGESLPPTLEMWVTSQLQKVDKDGHDQEEKPGHGAAANPPPSGATWGQAVSRSGSSLEAMQRPQSHGGRPDITTVKSGSRPLSSQASDASDIFSSPGVRPPPPPSAAPPPFHARPPTARLESLTVEDIDEDLSVPVGGAGGWGSAGGGGAPLPPGPVPAARAWSGGGSSASGSGGPSPMGAPPAPPLDPVVAREARRLLFLKNQGQAPKSWRQGFFFDTKPGCEFGLVQREGGPCGVLAAVQAYTISSLYNGSTIDALGAGPDRLREALATALSRIVWQSGNGLQAKIIGSTRPTAGTTFDAALMSATCRVVSSESEAREAFRSLIRTYMEPDGWGLVFLALSAVVTRGVREVEADMDQPENGLMGSHLYCTQDLVNLLLTGRAASNVFDGQRDLDGTILRGIRQACQVGFLTLVEWYRHVEVGNFYKNPKTPVWVVCSESHYTAIFAADERGYPGNYPCDLLYYDGLARQDHLIRLTLRRPPGGSRLSKVGTSYADRAAVERMMIPPLEMVVDCRWQGAEVDWNGSEPIL